MSEARLAAETWRGHCKEARTGFGRMNLCIAALAVLELAADQHSQVQAGHVLCKPKPHKEGFYLLAIKKIAGLCCDGHGDFVAHESSKQASTELA